MKRWIINPKLHGAKKPVVVEYGQTGYWPINLPFETYGLPMTTGPLAESVLIGSMFGWDAPGAAMAVADARNEEAK